MERGIGQGNPEAPATSQPKKLMEAKWAASAEATHMELPRAKVVLDEDDFLGAEAWIDPSVDFDHGTPAPAREGKIAISMTSIETAQEVVETKAVEAEGWLTTEDATKWLKDEGKALAKEVLKYAAALAAAAIATSGVGLHSVQKDELVYSGKPTLEMGAIDLESLTRAPHQVIDVAPLGGVLEVRNTLGDGKGGAAVVREPDGTMTVRFEGDGKHSTPVVGPVKLYEIFSPHDASSVPERAAPEGPGTMFQVVPDSYASGQNVEVQAKSLVLRGPMVGSWWASYKASNLVVKAEEGGRFRVENQPRKLTADEIEQVKKTRGPVYLIAALAVVAGIGALSKPRKKAAGEAPQEGASKS